MADLGSWNFFTGWSKNQGSAGIIRPFENAYEGGAFVSIWSGSKKKDLRDVFLKYLCSGAFQRVNFESDNQVPARISLIKEFAEPVPKVHRTGNTRRPWQRGEH